MQAQDRIQEALKAQAESYKVKLDQFKGYRGPNREKAHVELFVGDIVACCKAVVDKATDGNADPTVLMLQKGSSGLGLGEDSKVTIQADDAFHLLDQLGSIQV